MPNLTPSVSVVVSLQRGVRFLDECLDSVLAQTFTDFELVVAGDGTAECDARLAAFAARVGDPRLRLFASDRSCGGRFAALNRLLRECRGGLVQFLDTNDRLAVDCLAATHRFFLRHPSVGLTFAKARTIDDRGGVLRSRPLGDLPEVLSPDLALQHLFYDGRLADGLSAVCVRRHALEQEGAFDETFRYAADYDLWTRIGFHWDLGVLHRHYVEIRRIPGHRFGGSPALIGENLRVRAALVGLLPGPIQRYARAYEQRRHFVRDFHRAMRSLVAGRFDEFRAIARELGGSEFVRAGLYWLVSADNRLWRPKPRFLPLENRSAPERNRARRGRPAA